MKFAYNRGTWEDTNPLPDWAEDEEFNDYLARIGFSTFASSFGHQYNGQIEIYESTTHNGSFYASLCPSGSTVYEVFLPDFPSMMMFVRDYAPAFSVESSNCLQHEILSILEKQFQVQHGHPAHSICPQCDPAGWEANLQAKEERLKKKREAKQ